MTRRRHDFDQYITSEFTTQMKGKAVVVLDKSTADAILRGVAENRTGTGAAITERYLGLHDNANASVTLVDASETQILWPGDAGDRSLFFMDSGVVILLAVIAEAVRRPGTGTSQGLPLFR